MAQTSSTLLGQEKRAFGRLVSAGIVALVASVIGNLLLYGVVVGLLGRTIALPADMGGALTVLPVIGASAVGAIAATLVFAALHRFTRRPTQIFLIVSVVALLLSFAGPLTTPSIDTLSRVVLLLMHVIAAVASVGALVLRSRD
jgi:hypothetical protein